MLCIGERLSWQSHTYGAPPWLKNVAIRISTQAGGHSSFVCNGCRESFDIYNLDAALKRIEMLLNAPTAPCGDFSKLICPDKLAVSGSGEKQLPGFTPREKVAQFMICEKRNYAVLPPALELQSVKPGITSTQHNYRQVQAHKAIDGMLDHDKTGTLWLELLRTGAIKSGSAPNFYKSEENQRELFFVMLAAFAKPLSKYTAEERTLVHIYENRPDDLSSDQQEKAKNLIRMDPRSLHYGHFITCGTGEMCIINGSVYNCVSKFMPEEGIMPWEMKNTMTNYFEDNPSMRVFAIRRACEKCNKAPFEMYLPDFKKCGLAGLIRVYYSGSAFLAIKAAYPELELNPSERKYAGSTDEAAICNNPLVRSRDFFDLCKDRLLPLNTDILRIRLYSSASDADYNWPPDGKPPLDDAIKISRHVRMLSLEISFDSQAGSFVWNGKRTPFDIRSNKHARFELACLAPVLDEIARTVKSAG